ncbi:SubName: Full=Related to Sedlin (Trafficking protein particle complex protein 2) {ECO:0000313/EMBL:CCA67270.1} [Serendipita indica DSM 11827]|uniref:Related to Sedlin (Trafficking protein particle complex protein 2) n=1 Tax=Serendipita indica (strain DSM 11827) TaxID=1109443 RepID=G4T7I3_SERID|nr:SubName: Full=Related to Sedlin (Trafficking protein particle complex protein 2) {ECO:0000313/EMBL:CCA67270.1} [Serendipita indica DSM 11827]CCA67270.1 related to Sedlin (trafficking protein particle complex protein 2) [Serendipita indica DSM 11827]
MSHHLFLLSPTDTPIYSLAHQSTKSTAPSSGSTLSSNLPSWSTAPFSGTLTALSGAQSVGTASTQNGAPKIGAGQDRHVIQMIANASLDVIEEMMVSNSAMYLKSIDKFNEWTVSAFVTPGNMKFVLLHEAKNDEGIRSFFMEVWELYVKTAMNPFHRSDRTIRSTVFDARVRASAKKWL